MNILICVYICVCLCMYVCYVCVCVCVCIYIYMCMYIYIYVCVCVCVCVDIEYRLTKYMNHAWVYWNAIRRILTDEYSYVQGLPGDRGPAGEPGAKGDNVSFKHSSWRISVNISKDPAYFPFQPVLHDWCNKGCGMCYPVYEMVHIT